MSKNNQIEITTKKLVSITEAAKLNKVTRQAIYVGRQALCGERSNSAPSRRS